MRSPKRGASVRALSNRLLLTTFTVALLVSAVPSATLLHAQPAARGNLLATPVEQAQQSKLPRETRAATAVRVDLGLLRSADRNVRLTLVTPDKRTLVLVKER